MTSAASTSEHRGTKDVHPSHTDPLVVRLSEELNIQPWQAANTVALLDEQNTIPFIARYRKEQTGELDEDVLRQLAQRLESLRALEARRADITRLLEEQGNLTPELAAEIQKTATLQRLEDLYFPYRPKRRTRASIARERGLEPLAQIILAGRWPDQVNHLDDDAALAAVATPHVNPEQGIDSAADALAGARDIVAETVTEDPDVREAVRDLTRRRGAVTSRAVPDQDEDVLAQFQEYAEYTEPMRRIPPHRILAINRGGKLGALRVKVELDPAEALDLIYRHTVRRRHRQGNGSPSEPVPAPLTALLKDAIEDGYKRLLAPTIEREMRQELTERAEDHAIQVFAANLRRLLLQPPAPFGTIIGIDPAYRTGCKVAVIGPTGDVLETDTIYPHAPQNRWEAALARLAHMVREHGAELVAIGNGTASRETERLVAELVRQVGDDLKYIVVNEAGASVYSASPLAREELPDLDVSMRGAVSIARRVQDPLAELVKIDPQSLGVGLYQHDMRTNRLASALGDVVESCVNYVGVELNTASPALLEHVSGISKAVAAAIVDHRRKIGRFSSRHQLLEVPRIGPKTFEQCAGFLRVAGAEDPLDTTAVHPESYPLARQILEELDATVSHLTRGDRHAALRKKLAEMDVEALAARLGAGVPTVRDIVDNLRRPGRDPREDFPPPAYRDDVLEIEDLKPGMVLEGVVSNVVDFGAFIDIGVQKAGLAHISELSDEYVRHPLDVLSVGDHVTVRVLTVDVQRGRIGLSLKHGDGAV